jgi:hypothetical protein
MPSFVRPLFAAAIVLCGACAHEPSIDVASPNARLAGARLYVVHESGYRSATWGGKPSLATLFFSTDAAPGIAIESCLATQGCYAALSNATLAAVIARDGHAAAISVDDGVTWRNVALDGRIAFLCRHHTAKSPAELWSKLPTTRALAVELFRDPAAHADTAKARWNAPTTNFEDELDGALDYAKIANDESLWIEIARGWGTPASQLDLVGDERTAVLATLQVVARDRPAVRAAFVPAMASPEASVRRRVADVLALTAAEDAQDALASALIADDVADDGKALIGALQKHAVCSARDAEAAALASITHARRAGSPRVRDALHQATHRRFVCPPGDDEAARRIDTSVRAALGDLGE